ncbi:hypothetical protein [Aurantibacter sp.]|uniref:hypothetical protein n=1 Tax=Aurantibacter sp. TaxID=2807103 RepID=UPI00326329E1
MKKSIVIMMAMCFSVANMIASTPEAIKPKPVKAIVTQIYSMLGTNEIPSEIRGSKAEVRVAVDRGNFLRILSVETENEALKKFIKSNIDFQKLTSGTYEKGIVYRIPLEVRE